jgi:glutamine synthetase
MFLADMGAEVIKIEDPGGDPIRAQGEKVGGMSLYFATFNRNNRTVGLRVPAGPPSSRHVEHRVPGADANPYLVAAVVLAGMLRGIEREIDPGPPVEGNGYAQAAAGGLPLQWHEALDRAARSEFLADALGAEFLEVFLAVKRRECEKFGALVSDRDYEWYLDTA